MLGILTSVILTIFINPAIFQSGWQLYFATLTHMWIGWGLGYTLARLLRQPHRQSRTIAFETGLQQVRWSIHYLLKQYILFIIFFNKQHTTFFINPNRHLYRTQNNSNGPYTTQILFLSTFCEDKKIAIISLALKTTLYDVTKYKSQN